MEYQEIEVGDSIEKELILALKDHIETLKAENKRLRDKYEPTLAQGLITKTPERVQLPNNRIRTTSALIQALERRTLNKSFEKEVIDETI